MSLEFVQTIRDIMESNMERPLETRCPRSLRVRTLDKHISIYMGVRRCGKSTLMEARMAELVAAGVPRENIVWMNFADPRLAPLHTGQWEAIHTAYYGKYPDKHLKEKVYFFFDEIQDFSGWETFVEWLRRDELSEIYITGSSSKLLSREIATTLRGRTLSWELFPFSFREFLVRCGVNPQGRGTTHRLSVQKAWQQYRTEGGFPEVFGLDENMRRHLHSEYMNAMLLRDVIERYEVKQPHVLRHLATRAVNGIGTLFSQRKAEAEFKELGYTMRREQISQYLQWFEDAYFIFSVPRYTPSVAKQAREFRKLYCIDHALAASLGSGILRNRGQQLENIVFLALRRLTPDVYYHKTEKGHEVDFLALQRETESKWLVQVSENIEDPRTRTRELRALAEAMAETHTAESWLVTESAYDDITLPEGTIHVLPAYDFLLRLPE